MHDVKHILVHPRYDSYSQDFDFALLTLAQAIWFNEFVKSVLIVRKPVPAGVEVEAVGWGLTEVRKRLLLIVFFLFL